MYKNNLKNIRTSLYTLKMHYGRPCYVRRPLQNDMNLQTGVTIRNYDVHFIRRAVITESRKIKDFIYDLTFVAANKNFAYGAVFDKDSTTVIIDQKDMDVELDLESDCIIEGRQHSMVTLVTMPDLRSLVLQVKFIQGSELVPNPEDTLP